MRRQPLPLLFASQRGSFAIEYGLVLPVLLLFVLGIMDAGRLIWTYSSLSRAAEAAARCAAVDSINCATSTQIKAYAVDQAVGLDVTSAAFTPSAPACGSRVDATYTFQFIIPWISPAQPYGAANTLTLNATACYPPSH